MCDVFATVMTANLDVIPNDGIWYETEFPTLQRLDNQGKVDIIDKCNPDGTQVEPLWSRYSSRVRKRSGIHPEKQDESEPASLNQCGVSHDDIAGDFDFGTEYEVIW
jgi:hypothetical protein